MAPSETVTGLIVRVCVGALGARFVVYDVQTLEHREFADLDAFRAYLETIGVPRGLR
jgi:hypothetical protein